MQKIINATLEEFTENILNEAKENGITGVNMETFRQQYYDTICDAIRKNINITRRVYENVPDLHYWLYKHYEMIGYKIVENDWEITNKFKYEVVPIEAH